MKEISGQLRKQLRQVGANSTEINELVPIASQLSKLSQRQAVTAQTPSFNWFTRLFKPLTLIASGLVLGILLIVVSEAASPASFLYPVQKFSDGVAVDIHPQYRATVMMKRAQQVDQLISQHASSKRVLATLADYTQQANAYKVSTHTDYSAFEFCKDSLEQAAISASPTVKQAIASSLQSLEAT